MNALKPGEIATLTAPAKQTLAEIANQLRSRHGPKGPTDRLRNWKIRTRHGAYTLTIACRYHQ
jgi:hypothetical protein